MRILRLGLWVFAMVWAPVAMAAVDHGATDSPLIVAMLPTALSGVGAVLLGRAAAPRSHALRGWRAHVESSAAVGRA